MATDQPRLVTALLWVLWLCFIVSGIGIPLLPFIQYDERMARARYSSYAIDHPVEERQSDLIWRLTWGISPYGGFPTCFVLSAGFLCVTYTLEGIRRRLPAPTPAPASPPAPGPRAIPAPGTPGPVDPPEAGHGGVSA
jgi:hypothetical protein